MGPAPWAKQVLDAGQPAVRGGDAKRPATSLRVGRVGRVGRRTAVASLVNGIQLTRALGNLWNSAGFVVSDWGATHSTAKAANAGLDLEMPGAADGSSFFGTPLKSASPRATSR